LISETSPLKPPSSKDFNFPGNMGKMMLFPTVS
jgi:hypothetical protein